MANVSDPTKKYKSLITSLQKSVECPICLETLKTPFKLCVRGHGVCLACLEKLEKCPLCKELFTLENPICVKSMLEALPHLCRYSDDGCDEIVEQGNDHESFCGYRPIVCRVKNCSVKVPITQLQDHYKKQHPKRYIFKETTWSAGWKINIEKDQSVYTPVFLFGNWFWVLNVIDVTEKRYKTIFQATPIGELKHNYYARVQLKKDNFVYSYMLKASVLSSCESKFKFEDAKQLDGDDCMKIPFHELHRFVDEDCLKSKLFLFREELK